MVRIAEVSSVITNSVASCTSDPNEKCGNGLEKIYPSTVVRFGHMRYLGEFSYKPGMKFTCGGKVVIQTERGIELGEQVSLTCTGCSKSITREQIQEYVHASGENYLDHTRGRILREATVSDLHDERHLRDEAREKLAFCRREVAKHNLPMKLVDCEHLLGGERIIFYFMADGRIDFRALVKNLAHELHTRIEMRQIGARDEARLVADYETCGRECCCKSFLKKLKPISMRMAKLQKATLDPSKVSGRCGRLKCCLRYEHDSYEELDKKLPRVGKTVNTAHGEGIVVSRQILTQLIQIETEDRQRFVVAIEDVLPAGVRPPQPKAPAKEPATERPRRDRRPATRRSGAETAESGQSPPSPAPEGAAPEGQDPKKKRRRRRRSRRGGSGRRNEDGGPPGSTGEGPQGGGTGGSGES